MSNPLIEEKDPVLLRVVYTVLFYFVYHLAELVLIAITVTQTLFVVFSGESQPDIKRFSAQFAEFLRQMAAYMTWATEQKPYPFIEWPREAIEQKEE